MDKVVVYYHRESDTLDIWFGDPMSEYSCEEAGEGVILKKDKMGQVIGFEKLSLHKGSVPSQTFQPLPVEVVVA
jgi:uncharacterized protein YuzE